MVIVLSARNPRNRLATAVGGHLDLPAPLTLGGDPTPTEMTTGREKRKRTKRKTTRRTSRTQTRRIPLLQRSQSLDSIRPVRRTAMGAEAAPAVVALLAGATPARERPKRHCA
jgi:hypothetical protein